MSENRAAAQGLLRKAMDDLQAAARLAQPPQASLWMIGFHVQQSVEKAIKGVLLRHQVRYPFTHDISALLALVRQADLPLPPRPELLGHLTPFGTQFRYEEEEMEPPSCMDSGLLLDWGTTTLDWATELIDHRPD